MMDVWLLFGLVLPFLGFILTIVEEIIEDLEEDKATFKVNNCSNENSLKQKLLF